MTNDLGHFAVTAYKILNQLRPEGRTMRRPITDYRPVDIRPAPAGWQAHFLNPDATDQHWAKPLIGWAIRDEHEINDDGELLPTPAGQLAEREIVAAIWTDNVVDIAIDHPHFWTITGPGEPPPDDRRLAERLREIEIERAANSHPR